MAEVFAVVLDGWEDLAPGESLDIPEGGTKAADPNDPEKETVPGNEGTERSSEGWKDGAPSPV